MRCAPQPSDLVGQEGSHQVVGQVPEGGSRVEVDVVIDDFAQAHEGEIASMEGRAAGRAFDAGAPEVTGEAGERLVDRAGGAAEIGQDEVSAAGGPRLDVGVTALSRVVHRLPGAPGRSHQAHEAVGVARKVTEHVSPGPAAAEAGCSQVVHLCRGGEQCCGGSGQVIEGGEVRCHSGYVTGG